MNAWKKVLIKYDIQFYVVLLGIVGLILVGPRLYGLIREVIKTVDSGTVVAIVAALIAFLSYRAARRSEDRADKLFITKNKPLIDVIPVAIRQNIGNMGATTSLRIANASSFEARNVRIDLTYGKGWIGEWVKAKTNQAEKGDASKVVPGEVYNSPPSAEVELPTIKPTETEEIKVGSTTFSGSLDLEKLCQEEPDGRLVRVRVFWGNEYGQVFDEVHEYELLCTTVNGGRSFTFIPQGIVSQKGSRV